MKLFKSKPKNTQWRREQPFVKDDKVSVEQHVAAVAKELGTTIKVNGYIRFEKGEGIEKRQDDLAEEVAKLIK